MKLNFKINPTIREIRPFLTLFLGLFIFAFGWTGFLIPSEIIGGGFSGIAAIIYFIFKIPVGISFSALNFIIIIISIRLLGVSFGVKTIISVIILSIFFGVLQVSIQEPLVKDQLMATIIGGIFYGIGVGLIFIAGGSTGGTDIIAMMVNKHHNIGPGQVLLYCDILIIGATYFVFKDIEKIIYGLSAMVVASYTIDMVLTGRKQSVQMIVITSNYSSIFERVNLEIKGCATIINDICHTSNMNSKIVMIFVRKNETKKIIRIIKEIDQTAFISQGTVMGLH
ncbi:YitT family protein [Saccharicrinis sp. GN24d3]|uniref:YitT family protein n=1 Tax=Saccharicrinis sp. GN24d3 TaxID=3458416 RepID=UPI0040350BD2